MKIKKVIIRHFRSISRIEFDFPENGFLALVGPNNAGKSNIMKALYNILGEFWFNAQKAEINDFYMKNKENHIGIYIKFDNNREVKFDSNGQGWPEYKDGSGNKITSWSYAIPQGSTGNIKDDFPCTLLPANRSLEKNLQFRSYELMGKIAKKFNEKAKDKKDELEEKFEEVMEILNGIEGFKDFKEDFVDFFNEMQADTPYQLKVDFKAFTPLNYFKTINILANDASIDDGYNIDIEELGEGNKSIILFSLLRSYAKNMKQEATGLLAVEEPEIYLHPQARRHLYSIFKEITEDSNIQIIYTTHSQDFTLTEDFDSVGLVSKDAQEGTKINIVDKEKIVKFAKDTGVPENKTNIGNIKDFYSSTSNFRLNEGFFAKKLFLVEGETEEFCLPILFQIFGINCNSKGISIIGVNGKNQIPKYWRLFKSFGIDCYIIFDNDQNSGNNENIASCFNISKDKIENLGDTYYKSFNTSKESIFEQKLFVFEKDFENVIKKDLESYCIENGVNNKIEAFYGEANDFIKPTGNGQKGQLSRYVVKKIIQEYPEYKPMFIKDILKDNKFINNEVEENNDDIPF